MKERKDILTIEILDFGPISKGKIELKPLTIFIGPNNSGKSYAAMLIHSILETQKKLFLKNVYYFKARLNPLDLDFLMREEIEFSLKRKFMERHSNDITLLIEELIEKGEIVVPQKIIDSIVNMLYKEIFAKKLADEIARSFACPISKLIQINKTLFKLKFGIKELNCVVHGYGDNLTMNKIPRIRMRITVNIEEVNYNDDKRKIQRRMLIIKTETDMKTRVLLPHIFRNIVQKKATDDYPKKELKESFVGALIDYIYYLLSKEKEHYLVYYLPAARSGILQGHKALAISMWEKVPYVGIKEIDIPKFAGVVSDFISLVISTPRKRGPFGRLAEQFENELLHGTIEIKFESKYSYPEIRYTFSGTSIQLHRASSTVSEMAPISLYLKHIIQPGNILIIEEPEAHLHPENQRILAKFLVRLIRKDLKILITTHSEYLLEQLSNFVLLSKLDPKLRKEKYNYSENDFLEPEEVAVYLFHHNKNEKGYEINQIDITDDGISQEEFIRIHNILYEELYKLQKDLEELEDS